MPLSNKILLASHGTVGAKAAEQATLEMCTSDTEVTHLYVVPEFWQHMLGDDWLNNGITRERFGSYLEKQLEDESNQNIERVHTLLKSTGATNTHKVLFGNPQQCLLEACNDSFYDLIVLGSPRPKTTPGLSSRMHIVNNFKNITIPILQIPHPNA